MTTSKLSQEQKSVLLWLLEQTRDYEETGAAAYSLKHWGVKWSTNGNTRGQSAALSRTLARLEKRDLVIRQNPHTGTPDDGRARATSTSMPPLRCTHVLLTPKGRNIAEELETVNIMEK